MSYQIGDLVWAKMRCFPPWPGIVTAPPLHLIKQLPKKRLPWRYCVFFFGSEDYSFVDSTKLERYIQGSGYGPNVTKRYGLLKKAIDAIEAYIGYGNNVCAYSNARVKCESQTGCSEPNNEEANIDGDAILLTPSSTTQEEKDTLTDDTSSSNDMIAPKKCTPIHGKATQTELLGKRKAIKKNVTEVKKRKNETDSIDVINIGVQTPKNFQQDELLASTSQELVTNVETSLADDVGSLSETQKTEELIASTLTYGFIGLGIHGVAMLQNLLITGHRVIVWDGIEEENDKLSEIDVTLVTSCYDICYSADIIVFCIADTNIAKDVLFGENGAIQAFDSSKGFIQVNDIDTELAKDIYEAITSVNASYLNLRMLGNTAEAKEGSLVSLTAGSRQLYEKSRTFFQAIGKASLFLGEVSNASVMNLLVQLVAGITIAGLAEAFAFADRFGIKKEDILEVIRLTRISSPLLLEKGELMIGKTFEPDPSMNLLQKDLSAVLNLGEKLKQPLPVTATTNEVFKQSILLGFGENDSSAIFLNLR